MAGAFEPDRVGSGNLGAGQYLVQKKDLTTEHIRATWAVQLGLGVLFTVSTRNEPSQRPAREEYA